MTRIASTLLVQIKKKIKNNGGSSNQKAVTNHEKNVSIFCEYESHFCDVTLKS